MILHRRVFFIIMATPERAVLHVHLTCRRLKVFMSRRAEKASNGLDEALQRRRPRFSPPQIEVVKLSCSSFFFFAVVLS